jgi:diacylglycerol O-acyltransferase / wax synthase
MATTRLTPLDASFLHLEDKNQPMHVGAVMIFGGEAPPYDDFVEHIENRLAMVPRYRQRLANVPLGQGRPKWTDDEDFDICFHVRSTALPSPGGERELKRLAARVLGQPLNREKPLWEMWVVEGLEGDNFAVISKTHHAMVDGISGLDILSVLFADDDEQRAEQSRAWEPQPAPGGLSLLVEAVLERMTQPTEIVRTPLRLLRRPRQVARKAFEYVAGAGALAWAGVQPAPRTPYNEQLVGTNRRFTWVRGNLDDVKSIKDELGGTVNDVILTVVARALRAHLQQRGEDIDGLTIKAFVPVSMRADEDRGGEKLGNQVGGIIAPLPIGCDDPRDCLSQINEVMSGLKKSGQPIGAKALTELTGFAPPNLIDQAVRLPIPQRFVNLVVTNVPGPQFELSMGDRALQDIFPMVPLGNNMNLGVAIVSYNGTIDIGLVGDYDALYDLDDLGELFETAVAELAETAGVSARADVSATDDEVSTARSGGGNGGAPERRFGRDRPYEPAPEYRDETQTIVAERPVFPEPPVETEDELVEQVAERGAETAPGPEIEIDEPWEGYARMTAAEIRGRLGSEPPAVAGLVEIYERANKGRKQVIEASEKAQRGLL